MLRSAIFSVRCDLKPNAIIGVAAVGGTFTQPVLEEMARLNGARSICAVESDLAGGMHGGGGIAGPAEGVVRMRSPFDPVTSETRPSFRARATTVLFPGVGLAQSPVAQADQRRHVHGRCSPLAHLVRLKAISRRESLSGRCRPRAKCPRISPGSGWESLGPALRTHGRHDLLQDVSSSQMTNPPIQKLTSNGAACVPSILLPPLKP